jgi:hypothetical protein
MDMTSPQFFCFVCMIVGGATIGGIMGVAIAATCSWMFKRLSAWLQETGGW